MVFGHEPSYVATLPYELVGLGPVLAVRCHLAEKQCASLESDDAREPLLARFEIVDAMNGIIPSDFAQGLPERYRGSYRVKVILYWAYLDPRSEVPRRAVQVTRRPEAGSGAWIERKGPRIERARVEVVDYVVSASSSPLQKRGETVSMLVGQKGWTVHPTPRVVAQRVIRVGETNKVLPI